MRILVGISMAAIVALSALYAFSPRHTPPLAASQIPVGRMQFNAVVRAGANLVAGGELGYIMWSGDEGKTWQPASIEPRRNALITDIVFQDDKNGMAVAGDARRRNGARRRQRRGGAAARGPSARVLRAAALGRLARGGRLRPRVALER